MVARFLNSLLIDYGIEIIGINKRLYNKETNPMRKEALMNLHDDLLDAVTRMDRDAINDVVAHYSSIVPTDEKQLKETAQKLGLNFADAKHGSVENAYQAVYDVTEADIDSWTEILFSDTPDWLDKRRIVKTS